MKIHEYQAKQLFREVGIPVPEGLIAKTVDEAVAAFEKLDRPLVVVKSRAGTFCR